MRRGWVIFEAVGVVRNKTRETLELGDLKHLSPEAMAKVRREVMELDRHAYERSEVYRDTSPVEPLQGRQ